MAQEIAFENGFPNSRARDLDPGSGHTAYRRASVINLYLHAKFQNSKKCLMDGRKYVHTDGWTAGHLRST